MLQVSGFSGFNFTGKLLMSDKQEDVLSTGACKPTSKTPNAPWARFNLGVLANGQKAYVELFGIKRDEFEIKDTDKKPMKVTRGLETEANLENAQNRFKYRLKAEPYLDDNDKVKFGVNKVFLDEYSMIEAMGGIAGKLKNQMVSINGDVNVDEYKGATQLKFKIKNITVLHESYVVEEGLKVEMPVVANKESMEKIPDLEKLMSLTDAERRYDFDVWVARWNSPLQKNELLPLRTKLAIEKEGLAPEIKCKLLKVIESMITHDVEKKAFKRGKYYNGTLILDYVNGPAASVELTDYEKQLIELGYATEAQIAKDKGVTGARITEFKIDRIKSGWDFVETEVDEETDFFVFENDTVVENQKAEMSVEKEVAAGPSISL